MCKETLLKLHLGTGGLYGDTAGNLPFLFHTKMLPEAGHFWMPRPPVQRARKLPAENRQMLRDYSVARQVSFKSSGDLDSLCTRVTSSSMCSILRRRQADEASKHCWAMAAIISRAHDEPNTTSRYAADGTGKQLMCRVSLEAWERVVGNDYSY